MAKRDVILKAIQEGGATRESLMELADVDSRGLSNQFTYLRLMGSCPVADEEGVYRLVSPEEWDAIKKEKAANSKRSTSSRTPEERFAMAQRRLDKTAKSATVAANKLAVSPDNEELVLRNQRAAIDHQLAVMEYDKAKQVLETVGK